jgi:hypothetical protein
VCALGNSQPKTVERSRLVYNSHIIVKFDHGDLLCHYSDDLA